MALNNDEEFFLTFSFCCWCCVVDDNDHIILKNKRIDYYERIKFACLLVPGQL